MNEKGELFSTDATVAAAFMVFIILSTGISWTYMFRKTAEIDSNSQIHSKTLFASKSLARTQGEPADWEERNSSWFNSTNLSHLGLCKSQPKQMDPDKIKRLEEWNNTNYEEYKKLLNLEGYEFWIELWEYESAGAGYGVDPEHRIGKEPAESVKNVVVLTRQVEFKGEWARMKVGVWEE